MGTSSQLFGIWLLEQGSNLQALRHLINSQARLPFPPSRNELVERAGLEPASPACKAGALPIELSSHQGSVISDQ
jgi:hypothetical protein